MVTIAIVLNSLGSAQKIFTARWFHPRPSSECPALQSWIRWSKLPQWSWTAWRPSRKTLHARLIGMCFKKFRLQQRERKKKNGKISSKIYRQKLCPTLQTHLSEFGWLVSSIFRSLVAVAGLASNTEKWQANIPGDWKTQNEATYKRTIGELSWGSSGNSSQRCRISAQVGLGSFFEVPSGQKVSKTTPKAQLEKIIITITNKNTVTINNPNISVFARNPL